MSKIIQKNKVVRNAKQVGKCVANNAEVRGMFLALDVMGVPEFDVRLATETVTILALIGAACLDMSA